MVVVWPWLFSGLKEKQSCRCNCWLSGVSSTTQKNNAFRARILNSSEVSGKYYLPLSSLRDKIADLEFVFWPVFETLTEINHFMDPCVLYSIPFPLSVRLSGEYLPCRGWTIVYCPLSEAPACSQCKILMMTTTPSSIRWKVYLNFKLMTEYNRSLVSLKAFFVFCFFAFRTVLNLLFPLLEDSSIDPEFSALVFPQEAIFFANYFPSSHFFFIQ